MLHDPQDFGGYQVITLLSFIIKLICFTGYGEGLWGCRVHYISIQGFSKTSRSLSILCGVDTATLFLPINLMSIPRNVCLFPIVRDIFPKFSSILSGIIELTLSSMCATFYPPTNHPMVKKCSLVTLFTMHSSYGLSSYPKSDSVKENKSYHRSSLYIITLINFNICT